VTTGDLIAVGIFAALAVVSAVIGTFAGKKPKE